MIAEAGLVISLFPVGMHLRIRLRDRLGWLPLRLGVLAMMLSIALMFAFAWALGVAPRCRAFSGRRARADRSGAHQPVARIRGRRCGAGAFRALGEGGLNDGAAFPFALLGPALCGVHAAGTQSAAAFAASLVWGVAGALLIGAALATACVRPVLHLRTRYGEAVGLDGFIAIGLVSVTYGSRTAVARLCAILVSVLLHGSTAGYALQRYFRSREADGSS